MRTDGNSCHMRGQEPRNKEQVPDVQLKPYLTLVGFSKHVTQEDSSSLRIHPVLSSKQSVSKETVLLSCRQV